MDKPLQLRIEDSRKKLATSITNIAAEESLDYYFLWNILKDIFNEVSLQKDKEILQLSKDEENKKKEGKE